MKKLKTLLVNISPKSTSDPNRGHWHWAHSAFLSEAKKSFDEVINLSNVQTELPLGIALLNGFYDEDLVPNSVVHEDARRICNLLENYKKYRITIHVYEGDIDSLILVGKVIKNIDASCGIVNLHWADRAQVSSRSRLLISALKYYQSSFSERIEIAAESEKLASLFRQLGVQDVVEYPVFSVHPKSEVKTKKYDVLVTADDIPELNLFVQAAQKYQAVTGNFLEIAISLGKHLYPWPFGPELVNYLKAANFDVFVGGLTSEEYVDLLSSSKIQLLLYSSPFYTWGSSGRLLDGLQCRTKSIVPSNTALADYVESNSAGWFVELNDIDGLISLLIDLMTVGKNSLLSNPKSTQVDDCVAWVSEVTQSKVLNISSNNFHRSFALWRLSAYQRYVFMKQKILFKRQHKIDQNSILQQESLRLSHLEQMVTSLVEIKRIV